MTNGKTALAVSSAREHNISRRSRQSSARGCAITQRRAWFSRWWQEVRRNIKLLPAKSTPMIGRRIEALSRCRISKLIALSPESNQWNKSGICKGAGQLQARNFSLSLPSIGRELNSIN